MDNQKWAGGEQIPAAGVDVAGEFLREGPQAPEDIGERYGLDGSEYAPGRFSNERAQELGRETLEAVPYAGVPVAEMVPELTVQNDVMKAELTGEAIGTDRPKIKDGDGLDKETYQRVRQIFKLELAEQQPALARESRSFMNGRYGLNSAWIDQTDQTDQVVDSQGRSLFKGEAKKAA